MSFPSAGSPLSLLTPVAALLELQYATDAALVLARHQTRKTVVQPPPVAPIALIDQPFHYPPLGAGPTATQIQKRPPQPPLLPFSSSKSTPVPSLSTTAPAPSSSSFKPYPEPIPIIPTGQPAASREEARNKLFANLSARQLATASLPSRASSSSHYDPRLINQPRVAVGGPDRPSTFENQVLHHFNPSNFTNPAVGRYLPSPEPERSPHSAASTTSPSLSPFYSYTRFSSTVSPVEPNAASPHPSTYPHPQSSQSSTAPIHAQQASHGRNQVRGQQAAQSINGYVGQPGRSETDGESSGTYMTQPGGKRRKAT